MKKQYFSKEEIVETIIGVLEEGSSFYGSELGNAAFNTDYYIIGTYEAEKALEQYGTFTAVNEIKEYEQENFGDVLTDLSDPEKVANMLFYIKGNEYLANVSNKIEEVLNENWDNEVPEEDVQQLLELFKAEVE